LWSMFCVSVLSIPDCPFWFLVINVVCVSVLSIPD
jgi:hypothetical protein